MNSIKYVYGSKTLEVIFMFWCKNSSIIILQLLANLYQIIDSMAINNYNSTFKHYKAYRYDLFDNEAESINCKI